MNTHTHIHRIREETEMPQKRLAVFNNLSRVIIVDFVFSKYFCIFQSLYNYQTFFRK